MAGGGAQGPVGGVEPGGGAVNNPARVDGRRIMFPAYDTNGMRWEVWLKLSDPRVGDNGGVDCAAVVEVAHADDDNGVYVI